MKFDSDMAFLHSITIWVDKKNLIVMIESIETKIFSSHFRENTKIDENRENMWTTWGKVVELGLKRRCIFQFSRKCKNHAKMGRFSQKIARFCFAKFFVFAKISQNFPKTFAKTKYPLNLAVIWHA
jgi:hypothetical protein